MRFRRIRRISLETSHSVCHFRCSLTSRLEAGLRHFNFRTSASELCAGRLRPQARLLFSRLSAFEGFISSGVHFIELFEFSRETLLFLRG